MAPVKRWHSTDEIRDEDGEWGDERQLYVLASDFDAQAALLARYREALQEIVDSPFNSYDHPWANNEMYRGPYGTGVVDGHRWCTNVARAALSAGTGEGSSSRVANA